MLVFKPTTVAYCLTAMTLILFTPIGFGFTNHGYFQRTTVALSSSTIRQTNVLKAGGQSIELDGDENLKALFERAVVLQRSGATSEALEAYERFIKAGT